MAEISSCAVGRQSSSGPVRTCWSRPARRSARSCSSSVTRRTSTVHGFYKYLLREGATEREVYLPKGTWYEYAGQRRYEGGRSIPVPVTLDGIPVFVRGGAIVFRQPVVQNTGEMAGQTLRLLVSAAECGQRPGPEDLAHHGGVLDDRLAVRRERVEPGGDQRLHSLGERDLLVGGEPDPAVVPY